MRHRTVPLVYGIVIAGIAALRSAPLGGQAAPAAGASTCSYAECALRLEPGSWGSRLVRGTSGRQVGRLGPFTSSAIDTLLAGPDSAAAYARNYVRENTASGAYWLVGAAALVFAEIRARQRLKPEGLTWAAVGVSLLAFGPAGNHAKRAATSLSRSVWWYNAALATR